MSVETMSVLRRRRRSKSKTAGRTALKGRDQEGMFRRLARRTTDPVVRLGAHGVIENVAGPVRNVIGVPKTQCAGTALLDHVHPADRADVEAILVGLARRSDCARTVDFRLRSDPSRWCELEAFGNRRRSDRSGAFVVRLRDVTERRRVREALRESDDMLRALADAAPVAIIVEDLEGNVIMWSTAAERMFGWGADEVLHAPSPLVPEATTEQHLNLRRRVLDGKTFTALEVRRRTKDGALLTASLSVAPLAAADGRPRGVIEILSDVTERSELEHQLRQAQKMEAVGRLAGGIAHDFNNVMTAIAGYAGLMTSLLSEGDTPDDPGDGSPDEPSLSVAVAEIHKAIEHAAGLTQGLLAFGRRQVLQPKPLGLNAVVGDMTHMLRSVVGERIDFVSRLTPDLDQVCADRTQIEQVIINLVVNAGDALPAGGEIVVETANAELDDVYARRYVHVIPGRYVMLAVSDCGCGMDEKTRARVFEPFFTTKETGKGTGLGLSTVYGIVKQSGGYVWVYSEVGVGTTVRVYLPRVQGVSDRTSAVTRTDIPKAARRGVETVLVVEDEEMVRVLVRQVLAHHGYRVLEAPNGEEALQLSRRHDGAIHLMLTDVVMPGMSVAEIVEGLKHQREDTKVLCMSGYTNLAVSQFGRVASSMPFLAKPFSPDVLAAKVRDVLDSPSADQPTGHT